MNQNKKASLYSTGFCLLTGVVTLIVATNATISFGPSLLAQVPPAPAVRAIVVLDPSAQGARRYVVVSIDGTSYYGELIPPDAATTRPTPEGTAALESAARSYISGIPEYHRAVERALRGPAPPKTEAEMFRLASSERDARAAGMGTALGSALRSSGALDASGRVVDPIRAADVWGRAAGALEATLRAHTGP
jgi:hypothetical protein